MSLKKSLTAQNFRSLLVPFLCLQLHTEWSLFSVPSEHVVIVLLFTPFGLIPLYLVILTAVSFVVTVPILSSCPS
jgi:hypothetical protein